MRCQKVFNFFLSVGDSFRQLWSNRSKKNVEFISNALWILYNGFINFNFFGEKIDFGFVFQLFVL